MVLFIMVYLNLSAGLKFSKVWTISTQIWTLTSCARLPAHWFPDLADHKAGALCKERSKPWRPFFQSFFCQKNHLKTLSGCLNTQDGVVAISIFWTVLCSNVLPKGLNKQLDVPRVNCLVCAHTHDHVHTCCMLVAMICKMISLI